MKKRTAVIYAIGHFLVDFSCAYLLISRQPDAWLFVAYNFCAFALQMPLGLTADMIGYNRFFALGGILLVLVSLLPLPIPMRVLLAGLGNACYHVGGGREALLSSNKMTGLGIFVSPGAIGIYLGTLLSGYAFLLPVTFASLFLLGIAIVWKCRATKVLRDCQKPRPINASVMFLIVILRSLVGMTMETPWKVGVFAACAAVAAAIGKLAGGWFADRFGSRPMGITSLLLSALLFCFPNSATAGILGCLLFNMTMPITLKNAAHALPGYEGFSFGLLTFALFLGYLPTTQGITLKSYICVILALLSAAFMLLYKERQHD